MYYSSPELDAMIEHAYGAYCWGVWWRHWTGPAWRDVVECGILWYAGQA